MQSGHDSIGAIGLARGEPLRLQDPAGRHLSVLDGSVWVTQQGDLRDPVLGAGETFRFDRNGLALVTPLGGPAQLLLEDGLSATPARESALPVMAWLARLASAPGRALRRRQTVRELASLSDYLLRDLGLRRDQIECVARKLAC